ncbi:hypothetical protein [Halobacterium noricense]|uniref:hypothetical protein n=1 Tax=Halobacterium noricense TaxID=223182 RepID=UPI001E4D2CBA|nr:hypothetical protein [Halobacterium noricense]UHH26688.1 hypothetical protein LT974_07100 [Halobacterium noricense]
MLVFDVVGSSSLGRSICVLDLEMNRTIFRFCLVCVPPKPTTGLRVPPLNPVVWALPLEVEFNPETNVRSRVFSFEERDGVDLCDDFVGVPLGRFVPDSYTATCP